VLDLVKAFEKRRSSVFRKLLRSGGRGILRCPNADAGKALRELGWKAEKGQAINPIRIEGTIGWPEGDTAICWQRKVEG
jgi:hypothetical protein